MDKMLRTFFLTGLISMSISIAGCTAMTGDNGGTSWNSSSTSSAASSQASNVIISIDDTGFNLATVMVTRGSMVTWINDSDSTHTVTGDDGGPDSDSIVAGASYTYTFNTAGTYTYHSEENPELVGVIVVTE